MKSNVNAFFCCSIKDWLASMLECLLHQNEGYVQLSSAQLTIMNCVMVCYFARLKIVRKYGDVAHVLLILAQINL